MSYISDIGAGLSATFTPNSTPGRSLNIQFTPSTSRPVLLIYTVRIAGANTANQTTGRIELRSDPVLPSIVRCQARADFKVTGVLTTMNQAQDFVLTYLCPAGDFVNLATATEAGAPTFTLVRQTEIPL